MQLCIYAIMQLCIYAFMQLCNYANMQICNFLAIQVKTSNRHKQCLEIDSGGATGTEM
jgi:hypothetical protein